MEQLRGWLRGIVRYLQKNWFVFFALIVYVFFSAYYMGDGFLKCDQAIYGFGDSTAGPIWRNSLEPDQPPFGGYTDRTNYPIGENLYSPVNFVASVQAITMDIGTEIVGPVCAYNMYNIVGYVFTAMAMFGFVLYLTRNRWVALLSGYAFSFAPYVQGKIGGHPNYAYGGLLVLLLWLLIHTLVYKKKKHAILLAIVTAICGYLDPYFILLAATVGVPALIGWVVYVLWSHRKKKTSSKKELQNGVRVLALTAGVFALLILPLLAVRILQADQINKAVSSVRGDSTAAAMLCSNKPLDYLLPDPTNIHLMELIPNYTSRNIEHRNWCGFGESRVSISLALLLVICAVLFVMVRRRRTLARDLGLVLAYAPKLIGVVLALVLLAGLLLGLPPFIRGIPTLSAAVLEVTSMWRIFAREYLVVNMATVLFSAIALAYLMRSGFMKKHTVVRVGVLLLVGIGVLLEYQINQPFSPITFNYKRDIPSVYQEVKNNPDIKVIAEFPMDRMGVEADSNVYYMTMQGYHGKQLFNSAVTPDPNETLRVAMKDITDPQTIPLLRGLGIKYVVIHGETEQSIRAKIGSQVDILKHDTPAVYNLTMVRSDEDRDVVLVKIKDGPQSTHALGIIEGYVVNIPLIQSPIDTQYETVQRTKLRLLDVKNDKVSNYPVCFDAKMAATGDTAMLSVEVAGKAVLSNPLTDAYTPIRLTVNSGDTIQLITDKGYNVRLNNLNAGCIGAQE